MDIQRSSSPTAPLLFVVSNPTWTGIYRKDVRFYNHDYQRQSSFLKPATLERKKKKVQQQLQLFHLLQQLPANICGFPVAVPSLHKDWRRERGSSNPTGLLHPWYLWVFPPDRCSFVLQSSLFWNAEAFCAVPPPQRVPGWMGRGTGTGQDRDEMLGTVRFPQAKLHFH